MLPERIGVDPRNFIPDVTGVILAGGKSTRMGTRKAALPVDGVPLIQRTAATFRGLFSANLIVVNEPSLHADIGFPTVVDEQPGCGPLVGICSALRVTGGNAAFCVACDMPFLSRPLIRYLCSVSGGHDAVVPVSSNGFEPLHALYRPGCLPVIEARIAAGRLSLHGMLRDLDVRYVDEAEWLAQGDHALSFFNCNTPHEYELCKGLTSGADRIAC